MPKKQDILLIAVCLLAAGAVFFFYRRMGADQSAGKEVAVYIGNEEYARYSLQEECSVDLTGVGGGSNHLEIRDGEADVTSASCPDQICVHQAPVSQIGEVIVCMPNQVVVAVESADQNPAD